MVFVADNPEIGGVSEDMAEGGSGVSEAAKEALTEEIRKAAAQAKRDKKDEKKAKTRDDNLVRFIRAYIKNHDDRMLLLISRMLQKNIPVTFILGILSLNHQELNEILDAHLSFEEKTTKELVLSQNKNLPNMFGAEALKQIDAWGNRLFQDASVNPMRHLQTLATHHGVDLTTIQLTGFTIDEFLKKHGIQKDFSEIQHIAEFILRGILHKLHDLADEQGILPPPDIDETDIDGDK